LWYLLLFNLNYFYEKDEKLLTGYADECN